MLHHIKLLMKRFTLIALCALTLGGSAVAAAPAKKAARGKLASFVSPKKQSEAVKAPWCPLKQTDYIWEYADPAQPAEGEWLEDDRYEITYTAAGKEASKTTTTSYGEKLLEVNTYNSNNMLATRIVTRSEDGETYENSEKLSRSYDERITDLVVDNEQYYWQDGEWKTANCYRRNITRNADGNITLCEVAVYFNGIYDPTQRLEIEYGADGKASKITDSELQYDGTWSVNTVISDIEWDRTDGQICSTELMYGANRIKKAKMTDEDGEEATVTCTYDGDNVDCRGTQMIDGDLYNVTMQYTVYDNGGFKLYTLLYNDWDTEAVTETEKYDEFGLMTFRSVEWTDFSYKEYEEYMEGLVRYSDTTGYPEQYVLTSRDIEEDSETYGESINQIKMVFEGNADLSGISDVTADADADAPVEYFNLQGMRLTQPAAGQPVIRRQGSRVSKIVIR